jgi:hypothetical protein
MNLTKCGNCNFLNEPSMSFCTSCGNRIFLPTQSGIPTVEKNLSNFPTVRQESSVTKSSGSSKLWIGGLSGCLGLIILSVIGIGLLGIMSFPGAKSEVANINQNANKSGQVNKDKQKEANVADNSEANKSGNDDEKELIEILKDRKEAGKFKQLEVKTVDVEDFFPYAKAAAQTSYHDGSKYISVAIGKFNNFDDTKKNFDEQFANVKKKGGKSQILETSVDGTINGVYQVKGVFTAEYCTKSAFCYRMVSKDPKSLKYFIENFVTF